MRAIIIDDKDAKALLDTLELIKFQNVSRRSLARIGEKYSVGEQDLEAILQEMHHWFHYYVCTWLQEQGAKVT